jgi:hypothetical protein
MATPNGRSYTVHVHTLNEAADLVETLANLNYLACVDAHDPAAVQRWTNEAERSIKKLGVLIQSVLSG